MKQILLFLSLMLALPSCAQQTLEVAVFSINDFHSGFQRDDSRGQAGAGALVQVIDSLRAAYPYSVVVSAGDNFGGSFFHTATKGEMMPLMFSALGIQYSCVGNHEFDDGQEATRDAWRSLPTCPKDWKLQYLAANVRETATGLQPDYIQPAAVVNIPLADGREFRVGLLALLTSQTVSQASKRRIAGLSFDGRYSDVIDSVMTRTSYGPLLRDAHLRFLLTHIGTAQTKEGEPVWVDDDAQNVRTVSAPWHGLFTGHTHERVCGTMPGNNLPVVQGEWHGNCVSALIATVDARTLEVLKVEPKIIPVRVPATYTATAAQMQQRVDSLLKNTLYGGTPIGETLTLAACDFHHARADRYKKTPLGTLLCNSYVAAYRKAVKNVKDAEIIVGVSHFGSLRAGFQKGSVSVINVGEAMPFANELQAFRITGDQLRALLDAGYKNVQYGWLQTSDLQVERREDGTVSEITYTTPQGKKIPVAKRTELVLLADSYLTAGGDGYNPAFFPRRQQMEVRGMLNSTEAFIDYLRTLPEIR